MVAVQWKSEMTGCYVVLVVSIKFRKGWPREMKVLKRKPQYRLGGTLPPSDAAI